MTPEEAFERSQIALKEAMLSLHEDLLGVKTQISDLRDTIRNRWWIPVAVAALTSIATVIAAALTSIVAIILAHH
jgi:hypothetical protein